MASCLGSLTTQLKSYLYQFRKQAQAVGLFFISGRLEMDAKTGDSSAAIVLLHRAISVPSTPGAQDKSDAAKGWR